MSGGSGSCRFARARESTSTRGVICRHREANGFDIRDAAHMVATLETCTVPRALIWVESCGRGHCQQASG